MTPEQRTEQVIHDWLQRRAGPDDLDDLRERITRAIREAEAQKGHTDAAIYRQQADLMDNDVRASARFIADAVGTALERLGKAAAKAIEGHRS